MRRLASVRALRAHDLRVHALRAGPHPRPVAHVFLNSSRCNLTNFGKGESRERCHPLARKVQYTATGSSTGKDSAKFHTVDFAGSDSLLKDSDYDAHPDLQVGVDAQPLGPLSNH